LSFSPPALSAATLLHLDVLCAHIFLDNVSNNDWYLDTSAMHRMTGQQEFFSDLDSDVRGFIKFGDASALKIKGVGFVVFTAKTGEHRLLTGMCYVPTLRGD
jgi:hypothetical protein